MSVQSRGKRLLRRYPILKDVPEDERPALVRAALRHPLLLLPVMIAGLLLLPLYFNEIFLLLKIEQENNLLLKLTKYACAVLLPIIVAVPLLSRFVVPGFIRREMSKRGFAPVQKQD